MTQHSELTNSCEGYIDRHGWWTHNCKLWLAVVHPAVPTKVSYKASVGEYSLVAIRQQVLS